MLLWHFAAVCGVFLYFLLVWKIVGLCRKKHAVYSLIMCELSSRYLLGIFSVSSAVRKGKNGVGKVCGFDVKIKRKKRKLFIRKFAYIFFFATFAR